MLRTRSRWRFASARGVPGRRWLAAVALALCCAFAVGLTLPVAMPTAVAQSPDAESDGGDGGDNPLFANEDAAPIPAFPADDAKVDGLRHETTVYGADTFTPDSPASIRVLVNAARDDQVLPPFHSPVNQKVQSSDGSMLMAE